jgi:hypothetical protein
MAARDAWKRISTKVPTVPKERETLNDPFPKDNRIHTTNHPSTQASQSRHSVRKGDKCRGDLFDQVVVGLATLFLVLGPALLLAVATAIIHLWRKKFKGRQQ